MAKVNVSIPQGTRDFGPEIVRKRNYIFNTIRTVFELYGFQPLETPVMENIETLMGKYGEEGDKLIYRILDSGNPFSKDFFNSLANFLKSFDDSIKQSKEINPKIKNIWSKPLWKLNPELLEQLSKDLMENLKLRKTYLPQLKNYTSGKALRYDLTIPFARYVAMNYGKLNMPFKRYQIQPVWRADRPQKGRYREFYQCDADVVGSTSLLTEIELIGIYIDAFTRLNIPGIEIKINHRKLLLSVFDDLKRKMSKPGNFIEFVTILDKYDKVGRTQVLFDLGILDGGAGTAIEHIINYILPRRNEPDFDNVQVISNLRDSSVFFDESENKKESLDQIEKVFELLQNTNNVKVIFDPSLARGLTYYSGLIFEVVCNSSSLKSSIGGGGRYDNLTEAFGLPNLAGVGISFGVDRIYDVMEEIEKNTGLEMFPKDLKSGTKVLFLNQGESESRVALKLMQKLRDSGIACEIYHQPETKKIAKQYEYAEKKNILYAVIIGSKELADATCTIKNLQTGVQQTIAQDSLVSFGF